MITRFATPVIETLKRPYPVSFPMILFVSLVPFYIFIGESMPGRALHKPELPLDRMLPVQPVWALISRNSITCST